MPFITPEMLKYEKRYPTCKHEFTSDFSHFKSFDSDEKEKLIFCPDCRVRWFKDREWNPDEWNEYING